MSSRLRKPCIPTGISWLMLHCREPAGGEITASRFSRAMSTDFAGQVLADALILIARFWTAPKGNALTLFRVEPPIFQWSGTKQHETIRQISSFRVDADHASVHVRLSAA